MEAFCSTAENILGGFAGDQACVVATSFLVAVTTVMGFMLFWKKSAGCRTPIDERAGSAGGRSHSRKRRGRKPARRR
ncbi:hypothetical protein V1264_022559 [Littorina saxatilis]|uniref:Uncharacterized protein n=1 Tax=Littorina saxatilis TaxID=31220 RepID=A0AAN9AKS8_9CAEN